MSTPALKRPQLSRPHLKVPSLRRYRRGVSAAKLGSRVLWRATRLGAKVGERRVRLASKPAAAAPGAAIVGAAIGGATAMFFLDPHAGRRRRHVARDKVFKAARRGGRDAERKARYACGVASGRMHAARHGDEPREQLDDTSLALKVESEIFRDADAPKGTVNLNAENGIVYLRGYADSQEWIDRLVVRAEGVDGVAGVRNLLHVARAASANSG
jgi:hypothetical protein